jgi:hypothetical protein
MHAMDKKINKINHFFRVLVIFIMELILVIVLTHAARIIQS